MMRTIHLYGSMAKQFGKSFRLDVRSIAETAQALGCQLPGFRKAIEDGVFRITLGRKRLQGRALGEEDISFGLPAGDLHIVPVVRGSGRSGWGKLILGTVIAAASFWVPGGTFLVSLGASIALAGASQLLAPKKKAEQQRRSYMFDGGQNLATEDGCVPIIIGTCMCKPVNISFGVSTARFAGVRS